MMHYRPQMPALPALDDALPALDDALPASDDCITGCLMMHYQPPDDCITGRRMGRLMAINAAGATWGLIDIRNAQRPNQQLKLASYFAGPSLQGKRHIFKFN